MSSCRTFLRMEGISKTYAGVAVLRDARLEAHGGEAIALVGANGAGKSTLMNVLGGDVTPDHGRISIDGIEVAIRSAREAALKGIAFVHQELAMLPTLTVAENIFIDDLPTSGPFISTSEMRRRSRELLQGLGSSVSPEARVEELSIGDRQLVEIARALRHRPRIIIFDEPTSSLTEPERRRLFNVISGLKAVGVVIIYITHFLDEIFSVCERVTIMRNGETVWSSPIGEVDPARVVHLMLGVLAGEGRIRDVGWPGGAFFASHAPAQHLQQPPGGPGWARVEEVPPIVVVGERELLVHHLLRWCRCCPFARRWRAAG